MSGIQSLLAIGAVVLISMLILNFNKTTLNQTDVTLSNEAIITATAIAESMIEEIETKAFDENTVKKSVSSANSLTSYYSFGKDSGELTENEFDDVDDYNNYIKLDTLDRMGLFTTLVHVSYADKNNLDGNTYTKTFIKKIALVQTNQYLKDTLKISHLISY